MTQDTRQPQRPEVRRRRGPSLIWLVPILAAVLGVGIAYNTITSRGPTIKLVFKDGSGLEAGKTKIKYKAVEVGVITDVDLSRDLGTVVATAEMHPGAKDHLTDKTVFWKVSPHVGLSGISGLETLVSGSYVAVLPAPGKAQREFQVLETPPARADHENALAVALTARSLGSVGVGSPVTYQGLNVGEVERYSLDDSGQGFHIHALVYQDYKHLVKPKSQFWNASGIEVSIGAGGLEMQTASLASLIAGGIEFDTPAAVKDSDPVSAGATFPLFASIEKAHAAREQADGLTLLVEARDGSITTGAPVLYRKQQVGEIGKSELSPDATSVRYQIHIQPRYKALVRRDSRFWNAGGVSVKLGVGGLDVRTGSVKSLLEGGLAFATPDPPGPIAKDGTLFVLYDEPKDEWHAWAPTIALGSTTRKVAHVLPPPADTTGGLDLVLEAFSVGSIQEGDVIYYREVPVGKIGKHELSADAQTVRIHARIDARYATLVRSNSRFWNASGIGVHLGWGGLDIETESLQSILAGGVAFATPDEPGVPVHAGTVFPLHTEAEEEWSRWSPSIPLGDTDEPVEHAIHAETHRHLLPKSNVGSEAVAPTAPAAVGSPPPEEEKKGILPRLFGR